ncbi:MAG: Sec-independent protein translocase subunit TatA/TatB [Ilumatobacteraceae bacterium]|jgi:sec-independent protein translocase protein TatA|nr:twin-arginine translocase TatA/TatE family subunit [Actinomycetota bacterium]NCW90755.1 twin-arginine translocase TatA/TatE family subunit [Acidimicrobiia bacterium]NCV09714.1 twin-arginine translocase TatA/TatE family subunit [Actinomycetota bacterium]NCV47126.1 twin-arginine translocase TatA/TatE family subunit [Actinomycetota bacterium]NCX17530.1 twin-arginine translocase TatA/TatE family subunit [Acidimicrobiia bacterium]
MPGGPELWIIVALVVVLFGGSRLPKIARNLGRAQGELKKGLAEGNADVNKDGGKDAKPESGTTSPSA